MNSLRLIDVANIISDSYIVRLYDINDIFSFLRCLHCKPESKGTLDISLEVMKFPDFKYIGGYLIVPYKGSPYAELLNEMKVKDLQGGINGVLITVGF